MQLDNAQHNRADEGEREIGSHNAHAADESHADYSLGHAVPRRNAEASNPFPAEKSQRCCPIFCTAARG